MTQTANVISKQSVVAAFKSLGNEATLFSVSEALKSSFPDAGDPYATVMTSIRDKVLFAKVAKGTYRLTDAAIEMEVAEVLAAPAVEVVEEIAEAPVEEAPVVEAAPETPAVEAPATGKRHRRTKAEMEAYRAELAANPPAPRVRKAKAASAEGDTPKRIRRTKEQIQLDNAAKETARAEKKAAREAAKEAKVAAKAAAAANGGSTRKPRATKDNTWLSRTIEAVGALMEADPTRDGVRPMEAEAYMRDKYAAEIHTANFDAEVRALIQNEKHFVRVLRGKYVLGQDTRSYNKSMGLDYVGSINYGGGRSGKAIPKPGSIPDMA